jgi:hypothetical protein
MQVEIRSTFATFPFSRVYEAAAIIISLYLELDLGLEQRSTVAVGVVVGVVEELQS